MSIEKDEDGNFLVEAPDGHVVTVRPAHTNANVRFKNVRRPPVRRVEYIASGHQATINAADFDSALHREPTGPPKVAPALVEPVTQTEAPAPSDVEPVDFREQDLPSLVAIIADAEAVTVDAIEAYEKDNKGRKTVLKAVAVRRAELDKE